MCHPATTCPTLGPFSQDLATPGEIPEVWDRGNPEQEVPTLYYSLPLAAWLVWAGNSASASLGRPSAAPEPPARVPCLPEPRPPPTASLMAGAPHPMPPCLTPACGAGPGWGLIANYGSCSQHWGSWGWEGSFPRTREGESPGRYPKRAPGQSVGTGQRPNGL